MTILLQNELEKFINEKNLNNEEILTVASVDEGTLRSRFREFLNLKNKVWAKTGTLKGLASLSGMLNTEQKSKHFSIYIEHSNLKKSRKIHEAFVNILSKNTKPMISINYFPQKFSPIQYNDWRIY
jgi:D-alanyl-D-alanine carboxypeptidase